MNAHSSPSAPHDVADALHALTHAWRAQMRQAGQQIAPGLTGQELRWLVAVGYRPGLTPTALAEPMGVDKAQLSRTLDRLEAQGWLERRPHPGDKRSRSLHLSATGQALYTQLRAVREQVSTRMLQGCTPHEVAQLTTLLQRLQQQLTNSQ